MGNRAPVHRAVQNWYIYSPGVYPNNLAGLPIHDGVCCELLQTLMLESVFYVVALLNLPKLWLALFFVKAIKSTSEMYVATRRIFGFVQELEARAPAEEEAHGVCTCPSLYALH